MKKKRSKKQKELVVSVWLLDGFVGILALMIYNFALFILDAIGTGKAISNMQNTMGYFLLNSFVDLGFSTFEMTIGLLIVFAISFILGIYIGKFVRMNRNNK